ncbi:GNAT family N-acetyltransferase [Pseudooceanicola nanhaiensis]|uniref:GNAT family N-acetyltransferase n=1 Tax=Pseudooceanicola nanhaiensis TaxID=375761 RepID=UPI001CD35A38|nr:GNAT family N-acetyltransferase [Pseudooceanicola nanhaiensis]MCA0921200.1 GNAT family N-acetyltransferase [Pseudooceanicola nanhaiensis]
MTALILRPATGAEGPLLADLRVRAMRPSLEAVGRFDPLRARSRFLDGFDPAVTRVILVDGAIAGFLVLRPRADHLYLDHLYLDPELQGAGLGRAAVAQAKAEAKAAGLPLRLMALRDSPANGFYLAQGFRKTGEEPMDILYEWTPGTA